MGWKLLDNKLSINKKILSLGAGEDISFDIEIANKYGCYVDIFDPTPRSIEHIKLIPNIGKKASLPYSKTGLQPVESYSTENLSKHLNLFKKAVWIKSKK